LLCFDRSLHYRHFEDDDLHGIDDYIYARRIDWPVVIADMRDAGLTYLDMTDLLGIPWATFAQYRRHGSEPRHSVGQAILLLHRRTCGIQLSERRLLESDIVDNPIATELRFN